MRVPQPHTGFTRKLFFTILIPMSAFTTIPKSVFVSFARVTEREVISVISGEDVQDTQTIETSGTSEWLFQWLTSYADEHGVKFIAAGVGELEECEEVGERLWLEYDIVPILKFGKGASPEARAHNLTERIQANYKKDQLLDIVGVKYSSHREVLPSTLTTLHAYEETHTPEDYRNLLNEAKRFNGLRGKVLFISSTPQGGGVALMRHALIRLYKLLGVEARWHVLEPDIQAFTITKSKFHNVLQGVAPAGVKLEEEDKQAYDEWIARNAEELQEPFAWANVVIIEDWQPSGLISYILEVNPTAKIIFRSHIHVDTSLMKDPESPQSLTWDFVWRANRICDSDIFISHPIDHFVPDVVPEEMVVQMPATTDKLDGLNKPLTEQQIDYYLSVLNHILQSDGQAALDLSRPYITQIARFDPSKGIPDVLESFIILRKRMKKAGVESHKLPQLVLAGHGAVDDPDGLPILESIKMMLTLDTYKEIAQDIKTARLPHNDQILNAIMQGATVALQLSHKEGLEVKVTEALYKGRPIIIHQAGGMPLQVRNEVNAFVVPVGETHIVAERLYQLLTDEELYQTMAANAAKYADQQFFTVSNARNWLFLANELLEKGEFKGNCRHIQELVAMQYAEAAS